MTRLFGIVQAAVSLHLAAVLVFAKEKLVGRLFLSHVLVGHVQHDLSVSGSSDFTDVAAGKWFAKAVAWAAANGIVNGYGDSLFGPNDPVTREQLAAILYRYAVYGGMTAVTLEENLGSFADTAQLSAYAIQAMNWAVGQGLINGSGSNLVPKAQATRAQVAAIIHRYLERLSLIHI